MPGWPRSPQLYDLHRPLAREANGQEVLEERAQSGDLHQPQGAVDRDAERGADQVRVRGQRTEGAHPAQVAALIAAAVEGGWRDARVHRARRGLPDLPTDGHRRPEVAP